MDGHKEKEIITLGSGCFWCTEAIYKETVGIENVISGYMGGRKKNPSYREICSGNTGHAEVVQLIFDPKFITLQKILEIFWITHDPTTINRQGHDIGTQYRSVIFYHTTSQREVAEYLKQEIETLEVYDSPIITEITKASEFYIAESYHQNYYKLNGDQPYCQYIIKPKLDKFREIFNGFII